MSKNPDVKQNLENQLGEITFRRKLLSQQIDGESHFDDEFDTAEIESILVSRMVETVTAMKDLHSKGVKLAPFVEIGAERGQRSLAMENDLQVHGAGVDLSFDMLKSCHHYSRKFGKVKLPLRICADLYNAPFKSGSLPFAFGYQILHHFPDPRPIVAQVHRILAPGGVFYIADEPYKPLVHLNLYQATKNFSSKRRTQNVLKKFLDHFLAKPTCNEIEYGVIENDEISPAAWRRSFAQFDRHDLRLHSLRMVSSNLYGWKINPLHIVNALWGGEMSGVCRKAGTLPDNLPQTIEETLTCPVCLTKQREPSLELQDNQATCSSCGEGYLIVDGVLILMTPEKRQQLYPEIA